MKNFCLTSFQCDRNWQNLHNKPQYQTNRMRVHVKCELTFKYMVISSPKNKKDGLSFIEFQVNIVTESFSLPTFFQIVSFLSRESELILTGITYFGWNTCIPLSPTIPSFPLFSNVIFNHINANIKGLMSIMSNRIYIHESSQWST